MKRLPVVLSAVVAALCIVAAANASNGATTTPFTFSNARLEISCSGAHIVKTAPNAFVKDSETCFLTNPAVFRLTPGVWEITKGNNLPNHQLGWISDFDHASLAVSGTLIVTDNGDGTQTWDVVAYY